MVDPEKFLDAGVDLHGHTCEAMLLGLRVGAAAMNRLGAERSAQAQLLAVLEVGEDGQGRCLADGVQAVTGCTLGKGNIQLRSGTPLRLTLVDQATSRAVRVTALADPSSTPVEDTAAGARRLLRESERRILSVSEEFDYRPRASARADRARRQRIAAAPGRIRTAPAGIDTELTAVKAGGKRRR
jgi:formylmethanofuran dehydrogenase subunit E